MCGEGTVQIIDRFKLVTAEGFSMIFVGSQDDADKKKEELGIGVICVPIQPAQAQPEGKQA